MHQKVLYRGMENVKNKKKIKASISSKNNVKTKPDFWKDVLREVWEQGDNSKEVDLERGKSGFGEISSWLSTYGENNFIIICGENYLMIIYGFQSSAIQWT